MIIGKILRYACENDHRAIVKLIHTINGDVKGAKIKPIHWATEHGHTEIVKLLLSKNYDIEARAMYLQKPIHIACEKGYVLIVEMLLSKNCDIEDSDLHGRTPLYLACEYGHEDIVKILLSKNCNVETRNQRSEKPLHAACRNGNTNIVRMLLAHNCNIEVKDCHLFRPIHFACTYGHTSIVKLLIARSCKTLVPNWAGQTPIDLACYNGHVDIVKMLIFANLNHTYVQKQPNDFRASDIMRVRKNIINKDWSTETHCLNTANYFHHRNRKDFETNEILYAFQCFSFQTLKDMLLQLFVNYKIIMIAKLLENIGQFRNDKPINHLRKIILFKTNIPIHNHTEPIEITESSSKVNRKNEIKLKRFISKQMVSENCVRNIVEVIRKICEICFTDIIDVRLKCGHLVCRKCYPILVECPFCKAIKESCKLIIQTENL